MTSYVVIREEIDLMVEMDSKQEREKIRDLMMAVPLDTVVREMVKEELRGLG